MEGFLGSVPYDVPGTFRNGHWQPAVDSVRRVHRNIPIKRASQLGEK